MTVVLNDYYLRTVSLNRTNAMLFVAQFYSFVFALLMRFVVWLFKMTQAQPQKQNIQIISIATCTNSTRPTMVRWIRKKINVPLALWPILYECKVRVAKATDENILFFRIKNVFNAKKKKKSNERKCERYGWIFGVQISF